MTLDELRAIANALADKAPSLGLDALVVVAFSGGAANVSCCQRLGNTRAVYRAAAEFCEISANDPVHDKPTEVAS